MKIVQYEPGYPLKPPVGADPQHFYSGKRPRLMMTDFCDHSAENPLKYAQ